MSNKELFITDQSQEGIHLAVQDVKFDMFYARVEDGILFSRLGGHYLGKVVVPEHFTYHTYLVKAGYSNGEYSIWVVCPVMKFFKNMVIDRPVLVNYNNKKGKKCAECRELVDNPTRVCTWSSVHYFCEKCMAGQNIDIIPNIIRVQVNRVAPANKEQKQFRKLYKEKYSTLPKEHCKVCGDCASDLFWLDYTNSDEIEYLCSICLDIMQEMSQQKK